MKKRLLSMLLVVVMMTSMLPMSALAAPEYCTTHTSTEMKYKAEGGMHWLYCPEEGCTYVKDKVACADGTDGGYECDICGTYIEHEHVAASNGNKQCVCITCYKEMDHTMVLTDLKDGTHQNVCSLCGAADTAANCDFKYDAAKSTEDKAVSVCVCGATKEHDHQWAADMTKTDDVHYYECGATGCPLTTEQLKGYHAHIWTADTTNSTGTTTTYKCDTCGFVGVPQHTCVLTDKTGFDAWTKDASGHWNACIDPNCTIKNNFSAHSDGDAEGTCDVCAMAINGKLVHKQMILTSGSVPSVGAPIKLSATVQPSTEYGAPTVKWNRVNNLSQNTSTAMTDKNVFAAGKMYNTSITMMINKEATFASDFYIELDGVRVPFYTDQAEFNKKMATYDGSKTVMAAYRGFTDNSWNYCYITVCAMYAQLPGECSHPNVDYNGKWQYNATYHFLQCDICGDVTNMVKHFDFNKNGICDRCGINPSTVGTTTSSGGTHSHSWSTDWVEDISNHWHQCSTCGAKKDLAAHADGNNNGKCDTCGFVMTAATGHTHSFATTWTETAYQHYHLCSCGAKNDIGAHVDKNNSGLCDQCGYTMTAALNAAANGTVANVGTGTGTVIPGTGDSTNMTVVYLWMAAFAVSVLGLGGSALAWRKRKES